MTDQTNKLEPCPFCGGEAYIDQHGTTRQSCVISCHTCGCMLETNEEGVKCGNQWNRRASAPADILRMRQQLEQEWCELQKLKASYASAPEEHVSYPKREDVTLIMRKSFERLYVDARRQDHSYLNRNEQGAYSNLRVDDDWIFYQRAWADALSASAPAAGSVPSDHDIEMLATGFAIQHRNGLLKFVRTLLAQYGGPARWIPVSEQLPASGITVLAAYTNRCGNIRRIRATWVAAKNVESSPDSDFVEYDEETDTYYDPQGWYEQIDNWADYSAVAVVEGEVTHWMPLPPAPQEGKQ